MQISVIPEDSYQLHQLCLAHGADLGTRVPGACRLWHISGALDKSSHDVCYIWGWKLSQCCSSQHCFKTQQQFTNLFADLLQYWKRTKENLQTKTKPQKKNNNKNHLLLQTNKQSKTSFNFMAACLISFIYLWIHFACSRHNKHCKLLLIQDLPPGRYNAWTSLLPATPLVFCLDRETSAVILAPWLSKERGYTFCSGSHRPLQLSYR